MEPDLTISEVQNLAMQEFDDPQTVSIIFGGGAGGGKGLDVNTKILSSRGWKTMKDIVVGDTVFDKDGKPTKVINVSDIHYRDCYEFTFSDGSVLVADDEHLWLTYSESERKAILRRSDAYRSARRAKRQSRAKPTTSQNRLNALSTLNRNLAIRNTKPAPSGTVRNTVELFESQKVRGSRTNYAVPVNGALVLSEASLPVDPYVFGAWLGDGYTKHGATYGKVCAGIQDADEIFEYISQGTEAREMAPGDRIRVLRFEGVLPDRKYIPQNYLMSSELQRLELLKGLMDTDGHACDSGAVEFTTILPELASNFVQLVRSLGWRCNITVGDAMLNGRFISKKYRIKFTPDKKVFKLGRKRSRQGVPTVRTKWKYITNIRKVETVPTKCIMVSSESKTYLAGEELTVTHNSFLIGLLTALAAKKYPGTRWGLARKELKSLKQTTVATLIGKVHPVLGISDSDYKLNLLDSTLTYSNGSEILLLDLTAKPSDPEMESLGSLELTGAFVDEIGEVAKKPFDVLSSRVNRWMNKEYGITGKVVGSCNPSPGFVRQDYYDKYEKLGGGRIQKWPNGHVWVNGERKTAYNAYIRSTVLDNPFIDDNYIEGLRRLPPQEKKRLLEGDWNYLDEDDSLFPMALIDKMTVYEMPEKTYNDDGQEIDEFGKVKKFNKFIGCLPAGEMIPTDKGLKQIQDITVEDKLISDDGTLTDIVNTQKYEVENEPLFSIKMSNSLRPVKLTGEHPVMASDLNIKQYWGNDGKYNYGEYYHNLDFKFAKAKDIRVGQFVRMPNIYSQVREMPTFTSVDRHGNTRNLLDLDIATKDQYFWWLIGLWLGDGWCGSKGSVSLAYNSNETAHIDKTKSILDRYGISYSLRKRGGSCIEITISSRDLSDFLVANFGRKAGGKVIPEWAKYMPSEYKTALISGYIDSDGSVYNSQKRINTEIVSINFELLESVQDMLFSLGIVSNVKKLRKAKSDYVFPNRATPSITKEAYTLCMGTDASVKFAKQSSQSIKISNMETINLKRSGRKRDCFIDNNYIYFRIKNIDESSISEPVYNFETTSHTFCAKNISTHNCDPSDKGRDSTVVTLVDDGIICEQLEIKSPIGKDDAIGFYIAGKLIAFAEKHGFTKHVARNITIEGNGIGASLRDALRVLGWNVQVYTATLQSRNDGFYEFMVNADEGKIKLLYSVIEKGDLLKQLTAHRYDLDTGKPRITKKKDLRQALGRSPDHADSAMIANMACNIMRPKDISSYIRW